MIAPRPAGCQAPAVGDSSILILRHLRPDGDVDTYHLRSGRRYIVGRGSGAQVRVLDPKMSRHHAAFEVRDGTWKVGDLGSTNGVKVDGDLIAGWTASPAGCSVEVGASSFTVEALVDPDAPAGADVVVDDAVLAPGNPPGQDGEAVRHENRPTEVVAARLEQEPAPVTLPSDRVQSGMFSQVHEPEPATDRHRTSGALEPVALAAPIPVADHPSVVPPPPVVEPTPPVVETLSLETPAPVQAPRPVAAAVRVAVAPPPLPAPPADLEKTVISSDATYFVTVLGLRIGPVTRAVARDLKARELRGALVAADLDPYPRA